MPFASLSGIEDATCIAPAVYLLAAALAAFKAFLLAFLWRFERDSDLPPAA